MEWDLEEAIEYIRFHAIDNQDFLDADDERQRAVLNVAFRTITRKYCGYIIPDEAVYLFGAVLAAIYNDTNKMAQQGVASASIDGMSITFKDWAKKSLIDFIPEEVGDIIGAPSGRQVKWTVL